MTIQATRKLNQKAIEKDNKPVKRKPEVKQEPVKRKKSLTVSETSESLEFSHDNEVKKTTKPAGNKKNKLKFV